MKKKHYHQVAFILIPLAAFDASEAFCKDDPGVVWQPAEAIAEGSRCSSTEGDVEILTMGNDLSFVATKLRLDLPAAPNVPLVGLEDCGVRIPITVLAGWSLNKVTQRITYGVDKTSNTSAKITASAGFAAGAGASFTVDLPHGAMTDPSRMDERTSPFVVTDACNAAYDTLFRARVAISGIKGSTQEALVVGAIAPMDLRYGVSLSSTQCP